MLFNRKKRKSDNKFIKSMDSKRKSVVATSYSQKTYAKNFDSVKAVREA